MVARCILHDLPRHTLRSYSCCRSSFAAASLLLQASLRAAYSHSTNFSSYSRLASLTADTHPSFFDLKSMLGCVWLFTRRKFFSNALQTVFVYQILNVQSTKDGFIFFQIILQNFAFVFNGNAFAFSHVINFFIASREVTPSFFNLSYFRIAISSYSFPSAAAFCLKSLFKQSSQNCSNACFVSMASFSNSSSCSVFLRISSITLLYCV